MEDEFPQAKICGLCAETPDPIFSAPEVLRKKAFGPPADLFSFGKILEEVVNAFQKPTRKLQDLQKKLSGDAHEQLVPKKRLTLTNTIEALRSMTYNV